MTSVHDWNRQIIEEFRANEGRVGGPFKGAPMLLLTSSGAKAGKNHTTTPSTTRKGRRCTSSPPKAAHRPIRTGTAICSIEVGTEKFHVEAEVVTGAERDRIYAANASMRPTFADYQKKTSRKIALPAERAAKRLYNWGHVGARVGGDANTGYRHGALCYCAYSIGIACGASVSRRTGVQ